MTDDELTGHLQQLPREAEPPRAVRDAVTRAAQRAHRRTPPYWQAVAAAAVVVAAFFVGRFTAPRPLDLAPPHEFVLLLYGGEPSGSADTRVSEYAAWASRIRNEGRRVSGERLAEASWTVGAPPADQPLRGFFIIQARNDEDARALAEAHPHVRYGGGIVVRPVAP